MEVLIGIIVILVISWLLLWLIKKKNLSVLGLAPTVRRWKQFGTGFIAMAICCSIATLLITVFGHYSWSINKNYSFTRFLSALWFTVSSVVGEELIFRGAVLYILIKSIGAIRACVISAIAFGIYHWFTYGAFGDAVQMIYVFILTGAAGFMFAYAYTSTGSLYLPVGLHLGWNFTHIIIFSSGPLKEQLLLFSDGDQLTMIHTIILFIFQAFIIPSLVLWKLGFSFKKGSSTMVPGSLLL